MLERPVPSCDAPVRPIDVEVVDSVALRRLIDEVRTDPAQTIGTTAYNRTYHRHNR